MGAVGRSTILAPSPSSPVPPSRAGVAAAKPAHTAIARAGLLPAVGRREGEMRMKRKRKGKRMGGEMTDVAAAAAAAAAAGSGASQEAVGSCCTHLVRLVAAAAALLQLQTSM